MYNIPKEEGDYMREHGDLIKTIQDFKELEAQLHRLEEQLDKDFPNTVGVVGRISDVRTKLKMSWEFLERWISNHTS